ncbi:MAG TPA: 4-hydroxy-2-oxoheptanedioate aldolase [Trinickia sp.]|uniref:4-hydroxy-2-oxoheptanedioate aldolase n=1 Tax=Trinickia sp. TaxID=2571163 RepID=UPI002F3F63C3
MQTPENSFKRALSQGEPQIGLWLGLADAYAAELCAGCGFDWLLIDGEHAPNDLRSILHTLQAVAAYPTHGVVRIPVGNPVLIKQVLELGAQTLLVPMVDDAEHARKLVQAMRYPPRGIRGVGSGLARSSRWNRIGDYLTCADEQNCLLIQVESVTALANLGELCTVEGVDGIFIGAADLAASMGYLGQPAHPEVRAAVERGIETVVSSGKSAGVLCTDEKLARQYLDMGVRFAAVGIDTTLLAGTASALASRFKGNAVAPGRAGSVY